MNSDENDRRQAALKFKLEQALAANRALVSSRAAYR
jgi:hypothetical protein